MCVFNYKRSYAGCQRELGGGINTTFYGDIYTAKHRVVQLNFTPEIEVFFMLFVRSLRFLV